jgi:hypothetical protein
MRRLLASESIWLRRFSFPLGVSIIGVARMAPPAG